MAVETIKASEIRKGDEALIHAYNGEPKVWVKVTSDSEITKRGWAEFDWTRVPGDNNKSSMKHDVPVKVRR